MGMIHKFVCWVGSCAFARLVQRNCAAVSANSRLFVLGLLASDNSLCQQILESYCLKLYISYMTCISPPVCWLAKPLQKAQLQAGYRQVVATSPPLQQVNPGAFRSAATSHFLFREKVVQLVALMSSFPDEINFWSEICLILSAAMGSNSNLHSWTKVLRSTMRKEISMISHARILRVLNSMSSIVSKLDGVGVLPIDFRYLYWKLSSRWDNRFICQIHWKHSMTAEASLLQAIRTVTALRRSGPFQLSTKSLSQWEYYLAPTGTSLVIYKLQILRIQSAMRFSQVFATIFQRNTWCYCRCHLWKVVSRVLAVFLTCACSDCKRYDTHSDNHLFSFMSSVKATTISQTHPLHMTGWTRPRCL